MRVIVLGVIGWSTVCVSVISCSYSLTCWSLREVLSHILYITRSFCAYLI